MKHFFCFLFFISSLSFSQNKSLAFQDGEFLKYKVSYGILHAGFATLQLNETEIENKKLMHVDGKGWSVGVVNFFFAVEDNYQTYFDKFNGKPYHFIRKINEGGYTKNKEVFFNFQEQQATVKDHKNHSEKLIFIKNDVNDMLSTLYYFRNLNLDSLKEGNTFLLNMFFDDKMTNFQLKYIGKEVINSKFGKVKTVVFKPEVEVGRVFKENESVTIWFTDDKQKIPIKIKANVLVGSIKAELIQYNNIITKLPLILTKK